MDELLIEKYNPIFHFDCQEDYFPIDLNSYQEYGKLLNNCVNTYTRRIDYNTVWIYYICFYLQDSGTKCCLPYNCYCTDIYFSTHEYDYEIVIIEVKNDEINRVCYCPHGLSENFWIPNKDIHHIIDKNNKNKVHVYISRSKHASYPIDGTIWRHMGFANDIIISPRTIHLLPLSLTESSIGSELFKSKQKCLSYDYNLVPEVDFEKVKYRMIFG